MDMEKLKAFIQLAKEEKVTELRFEGKDEKYYVALTSKTEFVSPMLTPSPSFGASSTTEVKKPITNDPRLKDITSPFVGTFYRSSSPGAGPYVNVGDRISPGKVLCIVEAMKIMNEIEAEVAGEIVEICAENETYVEYGQVLYRVKTT